MTAVRLTARVDASGALELREPLPPEMRSREVEVLVHVPTGPGDKSFDAWESAAIESFFEDDDESDSVYDTL